MSIDKLISTLKSNPYIEPTPENLEQFIDGPEFFEEFMKANVGYLGLFKRKFTQNVVLQLLIENEKVKTFFQTYINSKYLNLDDIDSNTSLANTLNLKDSKRSTIAKALVKFRLMSPEFPDNHFISRRSNVSWYVNADVVGEEWVQKNIKKYVQLNYNSLDDLTNNITLSKALNLKDINIPTLAKAFINLKFMSPELPDNQDIYKWSHPSWYISEDVVGEEWVQKNIKKYIQSRYTTLDDVKRSRTLAKLFNSESLNKSAIAKICTNKGYISSELPDSHYINRMGNLSMYVRKDVVGEEWVQKNIKKYIQLKYSTLDEIGQPGILVGLLNLKDSKRSTFAKTLINLELMSPELPDNHSIGRNGHFSWYVDESAVGTELAQKNIKKYVQAKYSTLNDIGVDRSLASCLKINHNSILDLRAMIAELGWLSSDDFRPYANHTLPESFRQKRRPIKKLKNLKPIGLKFRPKYILKPAFIKGEALEQLTGVYLAYTHQNDLVIPQYCLDVGKNYFKTRVDFKVGKDIYEVKWGAFAENIHKTAAKHKKLMKRKANQNYNYHIIRLDNTTEIKVHTKVLEQLIMTNILDATIRSDFETLTLQLMNSADDEHKISDTSLLMHIRDYLYSTVEDANQKSGKKRQQFIAESLHNIALLVDNREQLNIYLQKNTKRSFTPLEAHFEYEGTLYRSFIQLKQLEKESPNRYDSIYYFGDIEFKKELNRNIAVMLECSSLVNRIDNIIENYGGIQDNLLFKINENLVISTNSPNSNNQVNSIEELRNIIPMSDELYNFALEYISTNGEYC